jgi:transcriptional regulator with XRE-family HTH domain
MYEIFEKLLKVNKVSVYKVAKEAGIPYSSLSEWKAGRSTPNPDKLLKLAEYFGVTVDYLLGRDANMEIGLKFSSDEEAEIYLDIMSSLEKMNMNGMEQAKKYLKFLSELPENIKNNQ